MTSPQSLFITEGNGETTEVRVGDLGKVEVNDDRLMDQLTLDLITGAKPSTTLRVRVVPTGKHAPIKVTYTKDAFSPGGPGTENAGDAGVILEDGTRIQAGNTAGAHTQNGNNSGDGVNVGSVTDGPGADGSVWAEKCEAKQAEDVYELELCVSMPEKEEWLRAQASINLTVPVLHFLTHNPPPGTERRPEEQRPERQRPGKDPGPDEHRPENHAPERCETEERKSARNHESREQRTKQYSFRVEENEHRSSETNETEEQTFGRNETDEQVFEDQGRSAPPGTGVPPGAGGSPGSEETLNREEFLNTDYSLNAGEPLIAGEPVGAGSELDYGLPIKMDPDVRVPVMMNGRVPLDAKTADELIAQAKWVYRMFTDPETGVVLESAPTKYYIPAALKRMVEARHPDCSAPWCATPARVCEKDHIEPFNHEDPESGGLTVMENLHPLCKRHHQEKTQKRLRVDRMDDGSLAWVLPRIGAMLVYPPESRINQLQYERLLEYFDTGDQDISGTINQYLETEHETAHRPETGTDHGAGRAEADSSEPTATNHPELGPAESPGQTDEYPQEIADEYAIAAEVFKGDTRPWQPSEEPPPF